MRWGVPGSQAIASLRALQRSGRWAAFWQTHPDQYQPPADAAPPPSRACLPLPRRVPPSRRHLRCPSPHRVSSRGPTARAPRRAPNPPVPSVRCSYRARRRELCCGAPVTPHNSCMVTSLSQRYIGFAAHTTSLDMVGTRSRDRTFSTLTPDHRAIVCTDRAVDAAPPRNSARRVRRARRPCARPAGVPRESPL